MTAALLEQYPAFPGAPICPKTLAADTYTTISIHRKKSRVTVHNYSQCFLLSALP